MSDEKIDGLVNRIDDKFDKFGDKIEDLKTIVLNMPCKVHELQLKNLETVIKVGKTNMYDIAKSVIASIIIAAISYYFGAKGVL